MNYELLNQVISQLQEDLEDDTGIQTTISTEHPLIEKHPRQTPWHFELTIDLTKGNTDSQQKTVCDYIREYTTTIDQTTYETILISPAYKVVDSVLIGIISLLD